MNSLILPIPVALLQAIALLISIFIEALIYYHSLPLTPKQSVEFSSAVNLLSSIILWWIINFVINVLPEDLKLNLISYIFYGTIYKATEQPKLEAILFLTFGVTFLIICLLEFKLLDIFQAILEYVPDPTHSQRQNLEEIERFLMRRDNKKASVVFVANAASNSVILVLLILRIAKIFQ